MNTHDLWPFFFEMSVQERTSRRERTFIVNIEEDGCSHWLDHAGRMGHSGGFGGFRSGPDGKLIHFRGNQEISQEQVEAEKREFTIDAELSAEEFRPIHDLISKIGKPWIYGWESADCEMLHALLKPIYWKRVNQFAFRPFDNDGGKA